MSNNDTAKTPYRRLQERVQELEAISKVHQEQNGKLQMKIKELERQVEVLTNDYNNVC